LSSGAAIIPYKRITIPSEMTLAGGESRDLGDGYSITVTQIDLRGDKATFVLTKGRARVDSMTVKSGEWFELSYEDNFYFKATLNAIFAGNNMTLVQLTDCESGYTPGIGGEDTTDTTPPTVTKKSPTGENVPVATRIAITFSEPMNENIYTYGPAQSMISGKFSWAGDTMIFTPSSNLDYDTQYSVRLYSDAMDLAYNILVWDGWNFKTGPPNNPPYTPETPSGPAHGYAGASYSYSIFTEDPDDDQIRYTFDWGDGTASETELVDSGRSASQSHVWAGVGEYNVRVMAADDNRGGESGWSPPLVVAISERAHPTAIISANRTVITEGETVSFSAEGSEPGDPDSHIVSYNWDFGDESTGRGVNVERTYLRSGHYTVTLTVTDSNNLSATDSVGITVEPAPVLSVSISTDSVPSGESGEVLVRVASNGDPVQDVSVNLLATTGSLRPDEGVTDRDGEFVTIFTAPVVHAETVYTIHAEVEIGDRAGEGSVSDLITVPREMPPTAYMEVYPNPADEGESVTLEGWGEDEDGEVVECRWTFPDGSMRPHSGDSSEFTLELDGVVAGWYAFAVRDDDGVWSEEVSMELRILPSEGPTPTPIRTNPFQRISDPVVLAAIVVVAAGALLILRPSPALKPNSGIEKTKDGGESEDDKDEAHHGSICATSDPTGAVVFVDGAYKGISPKTIANVLIGPHTVLFLKRGYFGYEKNAIVFANQMALVHRDLTKMPEVKLKLSADPAEIVADGESRSTIKIEIVTKDDKEIPIPVPNDTTVILETDIGAIESPVKIPRGRASVTSTLISTPPASSGTATVKAEAEYGKIVKLTGSTTVEFLDGGSE
jgi:chitodextrinase